MKRVQHILIFCMLIIFNFQFSTFNCFAQDTATVTKPRLSPSLQLYLLNPSAGFENMMPKSGMLEFAVDPLLQSAKQSDALYLRNRMAVDRMEQQVIGGLQKEQQQLQVYGILNMVAAGFVWGMIVKENVEGYYNFKKQQREGTLPPSNMPATQPSSPPPGARPPELRRP